MSSTLSSYKQNVTRAFAVTQNSNNGEQGAYFFADSDIDAWYAANKSKITKLGSLYIIPGTASGTNFVDVLTGRNGSTALDHTNNTITDRKALKDMGKDVIIGNSLESRLLVLRRVQKYSDSTLGGASATTYNGYVVVENNAEDLQGNTGRFTVRVARV